MNGVRRGRDKSNSNAPSTFISPLEIMLLKTGLTVQFQSTSNSVAARQHSAVGPIGAPHWLMASRLSVNGKEGICKDEAHLVLPVLQ